MTQKGKHWLARQSETFTIIQVVDGGIAGSLIGLGYVEKLNSLEYRIMKKGKEWIKEIKDR